MERLAALPIAELRRRAQSTAPEAGRDPLIGLTIRFFSIYVTKVLIGTPITPNQVTALSVFVFLAGMALFAFASVPLYAVGIFLVYLSVVLDGVDGEIARLKFPGRKVGSLWTEPVSHDIQYALMYVPLAINAWQVTGSVVPVFVGLGAAITKLLYRLLDHRFAQLQYWLKVEAGAAQSVQTFQTPFVKNVGFPQRAYRLLNRNVFSSVGLVVPLAACAAFNRIDVFLWMFGVYYLTVTVIAFLKHVRYVSGLARPPAP
ncbi:hypothetical protein EPO33_02605 [Patescibacteria group bacterium]|nr:MAG: hypothetical protein EPO33_02605 [Patescibacteria group bacterium]